MPRFTYQRNETGNELETYEWDNVWWEHTENSEAPRVLLVGDSISCGYRDILNEQLKGKILVDGFGTSKAVDNPHFLASLRVFMAQMNRCDLVLFNNGAHGWHLTDEKYKESYRRLVESLRAECGNTPMMLALTIPIRESKDLTQFEARNERVIARNVAVLSLADEWGLQVLDYYSVLYDKPQLYSQDGLHLTREGYTVLSGLCASRLTERLLG